MTRRFRKGAASFYIVAFSTLILVIVAASFATVIISEITRTSNDDLSQSAYDSALAGVEDAKLAYANYRRCVDGGKTYPDSLAAGTNVSCQDIVYWMNHPSCDMVGLMLGRIAKDGQGGEVAISERTTTGEAGDTAMYQAYTCVKIDTTLYDYRANLTSASNVRVIRANFANGTAAKDIKSVRLSWYMRRDGEGLRFTNMTEQGSGNWRVTFTPTMERQPSTPPTLELQMVQTATSFTVNDINSATTGGKTDRATVFLVPSENATSARANYGKTGADLVGVANAYVGAYNGSGNLITAQQMAKTNDERISNLPYVVYCGDTSTDFACSVTIDLPVAINANSSYARIDDTFMFLVTLPYGEPDTDFALEFLCGDASVACPRATGEVISSYDDSTVGANVARITGTQVVIDSTGRANDLYRRVETRLESADVSFPYAYYAIQLLNNDSSESVLSKNLVVPCEGTFYDYSYGRLSGSNC